MNVVIEPCVWLGSPWLWPAWATVQQSEESAWEAGAHPLLYRLAEIGPWLLAAIALVLVLRALLHARRYRALSALGPADREDVRTALIEAEKRTSGEIVPVVLERSDAHPGAPWLAALCSLIAGSALLEARLPWHAPHWLIISQLALGAVGYAAAVMLPGLLRVFISEARASETAAEQAFQEFYRQGLHKTRDATGVLIFVSLLERRVVVLGDEGIDKLVGAEHWDRTREVILAGIIGGSLRDGLIAGIRACGEVLAQSFPCCEGDRNELADRLVVRRE